MDDVKDIAKGTTKEDDLFDYANVPSLKQIKSFMTKLKKMT